MNRAVLLLVVLLLAAIAGGAVFLSSWDPQPPSAKVEKVVPNDKFPR